MSSRENCKTTKRGTYCKKMNKMKKTKFKKNQCSSFGKSKKLKFRDLYDSSSSSSEINNILKNIDSNNIEELSIRNIFHINTLLLQELIHNKSLKSLIIVDSNFTESDISLLKEFLINNTSLNKLEIDFSNLSSCEDCIYIYI